MDIVPLPTETSQTQVTHNRRHTRRPNRQNNQTNTETPVNSSQEHRSQNGGTKDPRKNAQRKGRQEKQSGLDSDTPGTNIRKDRQNKDTKNQERNNIDDASAKKKETGGVRRSRGVKFNAGLTTEESAPSVNHAAGPSTRTRYASKKRIEKEITGDDLTSNLIRGLQIPPYLDCPICFNAILPPQPTWSCSPSIPIASEGDSEHQPQYCWTTFHLKCIRSWAEKSFKEVKAAWVARGELDKDGEWRCPGCQGRRQRLIGGYLCFCGSIPSPKNRLATPHSCGNPCSRARTTCSHPCSLLCHPGPCPPCTITMFISCGCLRKRPVPVRCKESTQISCGEVCSKPLGCGKHRCQKTCHLGECEPCTLKETLSCWCGKHAREGMCGEGEGWQGSIGCDEDTKEYTAETRKGFSCDDTCDRPFDCGQHNCTKPCHPPSSISERNHCPLSPDRITTCPCGKRGILSSSDTLSTEGDFPPRHKCTDPIPTCSSPCLKSHANCEHTCQFQCHIGDCPPCSVEVMRPCRCGSAVQTIQCGELYETDESGVLIEKEILCDKPCLSLRACGKHQCNRLCCPLASLGAAAAKNKGKRRAMAQAALDDAGGIHECDLVCGKRLSCGNHTCEERDHKGPCKPCLRSSFEEMICFCGKTVLEPPIPCGTQIHCSYPCALPPHTCGHPKTPHTCHMDNVPCPPCVALTTKLCACGKKEIDNVRCSLEREKVHCGTVCGKLLVCGFHHCDKLCHVGECGTCTSVCGKARKLCLPDQHPCKHFCHAPAICPEDEPCQSLVSLSCPCGRIRQSVLCGKSNGNPSGSSKSQQQPKCTSECEVAKRNARLADALGINPDRAGGTSQVTYTDEVVTFARANVKFLALVEKAFAEFVTSSRKSQILPSMPPERRTFVRDLASVYRLGTQMVDQEPHRSVQIIRRIDTRIPNPLLSAYISQSMGKLADLRGGSVNSPSWRATSGSVIRPAATTVNKTSTVRGWTSVVGGASVGGARQGGNASSTGWGAGGATVTSRGATAPTSRTATPSNASASASAGGGGHVLSRPASVTPTVVVPQSQSGAEDVPDDWEDDA